MEFTIQKENILEVHNQHRPSRLKHATSLRTVVTPKMKEQYYIFGRNRDFGPNPHKTKKKIIMPPRLETHGLIIKEYMTTNSTQLKAQKL